MQIKLSVQPSLACRELHQLLCIFFLLFVFAPSHFCRLSINDFDGSIAAPSLLLCLFFESIVVCVCVWQLTLTLPSVTQSSGTRHEARHEAGDRKVVVGGATVTSDKGQSLVTVCWPPVSFDSPLPHSLTPSLSLIKLITVQCHKHFISIYFSATF